MKKRIVQHVGRDDEQVTRMQLKLLIVDNVVHVTAREKVHLVELVIVWFDVVIVVIHRVFDLEIALGHVVLEQPGLAFPIGFCHRLSSLPPFGYIEQEIWTRFMQKPYFSSNVSKNHNI